MTFIFKAIIIFLTNIFIVNFLSDTFDYFVDDLLDSDVDLLKGELDFLLIQHIFNSIDLKNIKSTKFQNNDSIAA